ncbi:uncharacterized protein C8orf34-like isoform X2 [Dreissena polymorpha]|uniref:uncharacterized protein C8orf34-like isoform X2 n=1 Tax=Dreissena polymorpha TaxID=45954 RepID=UPI0022651CFE|nr:uncharacterized protein C8orf34-like isoform X2 [Dreissena polymorpha]
MSKLRVQQYMEKYRLTALFEDLMTKVVHEQPEDPVIYLIKCLYKKAALPIPKDLRSAGEKKSVSPERAHRRPRSPEKAVSQSWAVGSGPDLVDRSYDKPWLTHAKKIKGQREEEKSDAKSKPARKQKSGWVSDTKVTATSFDELFEEDRTAGVKGQRPPARAESTDITRAWAKHVDLEDSKDAEYRSHGYKGPRCSRDDEDPLSGEIMLAKDVPREESTTSTGKSRGAKRVAEKHRQDLEKILQDSDAKSVDSGFDGERGDDVQDDAIELLEDPEDLIREGVTNIPAAGYRLSKILRQRKEETPVKLNINIGESRNGKFEEELEDFERPPTGMSYQSRGFSQFSPDVSDEEFESVSQVVGPRAPVWSQPDSDTETHRQEPPARSSGRVKMAATAPVRFDNPPMPQPATDNMFMDSGKTWAPGGGKTPPELVSASVEEPPPPHVGDSLMSVQSRDGVKYGWNIPEGTEVSALTDWSDGSATARSQQGPKAY